MALFPNGSTSRQGFYYKLLAANRPKNGLSASNPTTKFLPSYRWKIPPVWAYNPFMEETYERLSAEEKAFIVEEVGSWAIDVKFPGFDGNEEGAKMQIASFLVEKMGRFRQFKGRSLNSHTSTFERYASMYRTFEPIRSTLVGKGLSVQQLIELLKRS